MDEKSPKGDSPHYEHAIPAKTELVEAANPDAPERRQAAGINIVQNPLTVSLQLKSPPSFMVVSSKNADYCLCVHSAAPRSKLLSMPESTPNRII